MCLIYTENRLYEWQDGKGWDMELKLKVETLTVWKITSVSRELSLGKVKNLAKC